MPKRSAIKSPIFLKRVEFLIEQEFGTVAKMLETLAKSNGPDISHQSYYNYKKKGIPIDLLDDFASAFALPKRLFLDKNIPEYLLIAAVEKRRHLLDSGYDREKIVNNIAELLNTNIKLTDALNDDSYCYETIIDNDSFKEILHQYRANMLNETRQNYLSDILKSAWMKTVYDPFFANEINDNSKYYDDEIIILLNPLITIALHPDSISSKYTNQFISLIDSLEWDFINNHENISDFHKIHVARAILTLIYKKNDIVNDRVFQKKLRALALQNNYFWDIFFIDIYFRHISNYIELSEEFEKLVTYSYNNYIRKEPKKPLSLLSEYIVSPHKIAYDIYQKKYTEEDFIRRMNIIANQCKSPIEAKWVILSYNKIQVFLETYETRMNLIEKKIDLLSSVIANNPVFCTSFIVFLYLHSLLIKFIEIKDIQVLLKYESDFKTHIKSLNPLLLTHLQIEYASALFKTLHYFTDEELANLQFKQLIQNQKVLVENYLFKNLYTEKDLIISSKTKNNPNIERKSSIYRWLTTYIVCLTKYSLITQLKDDITNIVFYPITTRVVPARLMAKETISNYAKETFRLTIDKTPEQACKVFRIFPYLKRVEYYDEIIGLIEKTLHTTDYYIALNFQEMMYSLYNLYFYHHDPDRSKIIYLAETLKNKMVTNLDTSYEKSAWLFYVGIFLSSQQFEDENKFINNLWDGLKNDYLSFTSETLPIIKKRNTNTNAIFRWPAINNTIVKYKHTYLSKTMKNNMISPELWNYMATIVLDNSKNPSGETLNMVSFFYACAWCMGVSAKIDLQKYVYNFIEIYSRYLKKVPTKTDITELFIKEVSFYFLQPYSNYFAYKEEKTTEFFEIIKDNWNNLTPNTMLMISKTKDKNRWFNKKLREKILIPTI